MPSLPATPPIQYPRLGMAIASRIKGEPRRNVIAVIGDASIAGGLAFEGLNNAAASKSNLLIVLNDNDMAIANNVGSLNKYLVNITTSKSTTRCATRCIDSSASSTL